MSESDLSQKLRELLVEHGADDPDALVRKIEALYAPTDRELFEELGGKRSGLRPSRREPE